MLNPKAAALQVWVREAWGCAWLVSVLHACISSSSSEFGNHKMASNEPYSQSQLLNDK
jgi:hypothetical protein